MKPTDEAANNQPTDTPAVSASNDMDLSAINAAITESANAAAQDLQNTFDVENISLDNTPTTDAELAAQQAADPNLSLAGTPAATSAPAPAPADPAATPASAAPAQQAAETAGFVDGDLMDDPAAAAAPAPATAPDYEAIKADPVESFDESAPASADPAAAAAAPETNKLKQPIKIPKTNLDFNSVLHNNVAIIGIVVGAILILVLALVIIIVLA